MGEITRYACAQKYVQSELLFGGSEWRDARSSKVRISVSGCNRNVLLVLSKINTVLSRSFSNYARFEGMMCSAPIEWPVCRPGDKTGPPRWLKPPIALIRSRQLIGVEHFDRYLDLVLGVYAIYLAHSDARRLRRQKLTISPRWLFLMRSYVPF